MKIADVLMLIGGLALFLHGMRMMGDGLEAAAGNKLKGILEKLTSNPFLGVLVGAGLTAVIQSSSATTVMVVGFVNSGMMSLAQAVGVIMGANIGTTITGQLIALDIGAIAPVFAFAGILIVMFSKRRTLVSFGNIIMGLGILFIGMGMMSDAMEPLRSEPAFLNMMTSFSNPVVGILTGMAFTAIIQSSSASIGILQTLAAGGMITFSNSVFILFGMNIGTCITAVIASLGTNRNARRTTMVHILFNVIGAVLFTVICLYTPLTGWIGSWTPDRPAAQIANMHTVFNLVTSLLLFPFRGYLARFATMILPVRDNESGLPQLRFISNKKIGSVSIAITNLCQELSIMLGLAKTNVKLALGAVISRSEQNVEQIRSNEEYIDYLNTEITRYMADVTGNEMPVEDAKKINALFRVTTDLERIGDHAENISEYLGALKEKSISFSESATNELKKIDQTLEASLAAISNFGKEADMLDRVNEYEDKIDRITKTYLNNQIQSMASKECSVEGGVIYSELLTDVERISDHILNIAQAFSSVDIELPEADTPSAQPVRLTV